MAHAIDFALLREVVAILRAEGHGGHATAVEVAIAALAERTREPKGT